ncbi:hypothetical protein [Micromonospora chersina]|uniref:hypothetical protein n=1 Tax=Micromonospora chersina TaxID=47854 RepID=UPI003D93800D
MDSEIYPISDGDGLMVIGEAEAVEKRLVAEGLWSKSQDLGQRLKPFLRLGSAAAQAGSEIQATSARWVLLTKESARRRKLSGLREAAKSGNPTGVFKGKKPGQIGGFVEFIKGPQSLLNPASLTGIAGIMGQVAMEQTMAEITAYLGRIEVKVDDVLRKQDDAKVSDLIGVRHEIELALAIRKQLDGRFSSESWSRVQHTPTIIQATQDYALRQLNAITEKVRKASAIRDLAQAAEEAERLVVDWLVVLALCAYLQDAVDSLYLDRVLDGSPEELGAHLHALTAARTERFDLLSRGTEALLACLDAAARTANDKVLLHPAISPAVVGSRNHVAAIARDFHDQLGIESESRQAWKATRWSDAAALAGSAVAQVAAKSADSPVAVSAAVTVAVTIGKQLRKKA